MQSSLMRAYQPPKKGPIISHLLFADDCLHVAKTIVKMWHVKKLLLMPIVTS